MKLQIKWVISSCFFCIVFTHAKYDLTRFRIAPKDVTFYYNSRMVLHEHCSPLNTSSTITWLKNGRRIKYNSRIRMVVTNGDEYWYMENVDSESIIYQLIIDPLLSSDEGLYTCQSRNTYEEASVDFFVNITDECPEKSFKCFDSRTCLLPSAVCDGNAHCKDKRDESIEIGCGLPEVPFLELTKRFTKMLEFHWSPISNVIAYEVKITNSNMNKTIQLDGDYSSVTVDDLQPGTDYDISIRSISHTGKSEYSPAIKVSTITAGIPPVPEHPRSTFQTKSSLSFVWDNVKDASNYEVEIKFPDGEARKTISYPNRPGVVFENLIDNQTYILRVRSRSVNGYSNFTKPLPVRTRILGAPSSPLELYAEVDQQDVIIMWKHPKELGNHNSYELTYQITYCPLDKIKIQINGTEIHRLGRCEITKRVSDTILRVTNLKSFTLYTYTVTSYGLKNIKGGSDIGYFTTTMYTTGQPTTEFNPYSTGNEQFSGIVIFGIVTGSLIVLLVFAFIFAYICKWKLLMDAMEEYNLNQGKKDGSKSNLSQKSDVLLENYEKY